MLKVERLIGDLATLVLLYIGFLKERRAEKILLYMCSISTLYAMVSDCGFHFMFSRLKDE